MRLKKAIINTSIAILSEFVTVICGLILPRMILATFGSKYNGVVSSITQFLQCIALLNAGISGVTRAALFKPLADKDKYSISAIVKSTERYMRRIAKIFVAVLIVFALIYPLIVKSEFEWVFTFSLVLIIGISTFAQYFFGTAYQMLLSADQRNYIVSGFTTISIILNTIIAIIIIKMNGTIHAVKLGSAAIYVLQPIILRKYVVMKYGILNKVIVDDSALKQRRYALAHTFANYVHDNTDIVVLTLFSTMKEVSVYVIYNLVISNIRKILKSFTAGIEAAFGNMMAKKENLVLKKTIGEFETFMFWSSSIFFTCTTLLIVQFVDIYTKGIIDANYHRPLFAYTFTVAEYFYCIRIPYYSVIQAAGRYKETQVGALLEAVINLVISLALVKWLGILGVAIGTLIAMIFRTLQYGFYVYREILHTNLIGMIKKVLVYLGGILLSIGMSRLLFLDRILFTEFGDWIISALCIFLNVFLVITAFTIIFYRKDVQGISGYVKRILKKGK